MRTIICLSSTSQQAGGTQGALPNSESVVVHAGEYLKRKYNKPGNVFIGVVSRLDALVTGVLPLARTSKAAARLSEQIRDRSMRKVYWALVQGKMPKENGTLEHWLLRREQDLVTKVCREPQSGAQQAILHYQRLGVRGEYEWLEIDLETGRKHQIRAQLAHMGCPILGDVRYGAKEVRWLGIGLHCRRIEFLHPTLKSPMDLTADPPDTWPDV